MDKFEKITDVLLSYARGAAPDMLPRVYLHFMYTPSDIPVDDSWTLTVDLAAYEKVDKDIPTFTSQWKSTGIDRDTCMDLILKQLADFLTDALSKKMVEQEALETAMNILTAESTVGELWQQNPQDSALAEEAADEARGQNPSLIILAKS